MRRIAAFALILGIAFMTIVTHANELHADIGVIYRINRQTNEVFIMSSDGNLWVINDDVNDWNNGDTVRIVFATVGTEEIIDDEIVSIKIYDE